MHAVLSSLSAAYGNKLCNYGKKEGGFMRENTGKYVKNQHVQAEKEKDIL